MGMSGDTGKPPLLPFVSLLFFSFPLTERLAQTRIIQEIAFNLYDVSNKNLVYQTSTTFSPCYL